MCVQAWSQPDRLRFRLCAMELGHGTPEAMLVECSLWCSVNCSIYCLLFSYQRNVLCCMREVGL